MNYSDKQLQIIEIAETLFAENGFHGTSIRDIAEKGNINIAMVSYYFGSKEKLLEAIFEFRGEKTKLKLESIVQKSGLKAMEKIDLLIDHYIEKIMMSQNFHKIMVREQVLNNSIPISDLILALKRINLDIISKLIVEGQENGEFKMDIHIPMMMTIMVGTANNLITSKQYYRELSNLQALSEEDFHDHIKSTLSTHLKFLIKTMLTNEF